MKVIGLNKVISNLQKAEKRIQDKAEKAINTSALRIETDAKRRSPANTARLRASIQTKPSGQIGREVFTPVKYAPYMEFGTKSQVQIPAGLERYASQFKGGGGSFDELVDNIAVWARQKGIEEDAVYPIALKIAREGVKPRPFLFPAFEAEKPKLMRKLKEIAK